VIATMKRRSTRPYVHPSPTLEPPFPTLEELEQALDASSNDYDRITILGQLTTVLRRVDTPRSMAYAGEALDLARATGDADAICWSLLLAARASIAVPDLAQAWRWLDEARSLSDRCTSLVCVAQTFHYRGIFYDYEFEIVKAMSELAVAREIAERAGHPTVLAYILCSIAASARRLGRLGEILELLQRARGLAREGGDAELEIWVVGQLGRTASDLEDADTALAYVQEAVERSEALGLRRALFRSRLHYADLLGLIGRTSEALEIDALAIADIGEATMRERTAFELSAATRLMSVGRFGEARDLVEAAIEELEASAVPPTIDALVSRAQVTFGLGDPVDAIRQLEEAMTEAHRREEPLSVLFCVEALASIHEAVGNHAEALRLEKEGEALREPINGAEAQRQAARIAMETELAEAERESARAREEADRLERELAERERDLAAAAQQVVETSELLESTMREMRDLSSDASHGARQSVRTLVRRVESNRDSGSYWGRFDEQFEKVHAGFTTELMRRFPQLTAMELRLCALLKLGKPTKEIAELMATSTENVEVYRYRIRKKLGLERSVTFPQFFASIHHSG
jgi:tetratricopeptide (TPR) repeat protein